MPYQRFSEEPWELPSSRWDEVKDKPVSGKVNRRVVIVYEKVTDEEHYWVNGYPNPFDPVKFAKGGDAGFLPGEEEEEKDWHLTFMLHLLGLTWDLQTWKEYSFLQLCRDPLAFIFCWTPFYWWIYFFSSKEEKLIFAIEFSSRTLNGYTGENPKLQKLAEFLASLKAKA